MFMTGQLPSIILGLCVRPFGGGVQGPYSQRFLFLELVLFLEFFLELLFFLEKF